MRDDDPERLEPLHEMDPAGLAGETNARLDRVGEAIRHMAGLRTQTPWHGHEHTAELDEALDAARFDRYVLGMCEELWPDAPAAYWWPLELTPAEQARADETAEFLRDHPRFVVPLPPNYYVVGTISDGGHFMALDEFSQRAYHHAMAQPRYVCSNTLAWAEPGWKRALRVAWCNLRHPLIWLDERRAVTQ